MNDTTPLSPERRQRRWLRGLRPLLWWLILVLALFAIRTHQRLSEKTRLTFSVSMQGRPVLYEASAMLDKQQIASGCRVPIGWYRFAVSHPKAEAYVTNLLIWYGPHDLGEIALKRGRGVLALEVAPAAALVTIRGPDYRVTLTNSPGVTSSIPSDPYVVEARYAHWEQTERVSVSAGMTTMQRISPRLGAMQVLCNRDDASFRLLTGDSQLMVASRFPATIAELPVGNYRLIAQHHRNQREENVLVKAGVTNNVRIEFNYGTAVLDTEPSGATVTGGEGQDWGVTPVALSELVPGTWEFRLRREGYEPASVLMTISVNQTNSFHTNLVSRSYTMAMSAARQYMASGNYERAIEALEDACRAKPNDPDAVALKRDASGQAGIQRAVALGKQGDYIAGIKELESVLQYLAENEEAKQLLADFKRREPEQIEQRRQERLSLPRKLFGSFTAKINGADLYETHELKTSKPLKEVELAIVEQFGSVAPIFKLSHHESPTPETFQMDANQELSGGGRLCMIVGGQTKDDETQILFKVVEYKGEAVYKLSIGALLGVGPMNYTPINPSQTHLSDKQKNQLLEGARIVTEKIQRAIGQASAETQ